ncbi:anthranilate phosphoribosyltransferase [Thiobacillus sp.]|uniref:anthranilate phosphoribosyltransferase n=1 Tax=Thiobacillus sp. TaxID=924 RepID=UPI0025D1F7A4|nr:anthranilate phosphoribosyltransferase [Thiobacillus sp.]MBT9541074.1 anthranilate phosphoribosyltransferase [Thiobacillus sp.]
MQHKDLLTLIIERHDLPHDAMLAAMRAVMGGEWTPVQIASFLVALRMKGESVNEIAAAAEVMRELSTKVPLAGVEHLVDTCGTGGDGAHTFNISTASAFVAAACGARVAKHGGRSVSSTSGSADVLEALGVNVNLSPDKVAEAVKTLGVGFMFAPNHHSAMKHAAPVRRELGVRTLFNLLGPLTNPAGAPNQVMGVFSRELTGTLARVLQSLGSRHVLVVHAEEGLDEISLASPTFVAELKDGHVSEYELEPGLFGLPQVAASELVVNGKDEAVEMLLAALENRHAGAAAIVALNAGAAIYVSGRAVSLMDGVAQARQAIACCTARDVLEHYRRFSQA